MMVYAHKVIGTNILKQLDNEYKYCINKAVFVWGNIKPDCSRKYKKIRHYYNESIDAIIELIEQICSYDIKEIYEKNKINKLSEELGVICHFLSDYFCAPHYYRWECTSKEAMKDHMTYEIKQQAMCKKYMPEVMPNKELARENVREFIEELQKEYDGEIDYFKDLSYAYYVCVSVTDMILNEVFKNSVLPADKNHKHII